MPTPAEEQVKRDRVLAKKIGAGLTDLGTLPRRAGASVLDQVLRIPRALGADISPVTRDPFSLTPNLDVLNPAAPPVRAATPAATNFSALPGIPPAAPVPAPVPTVIAKPRGQNYAENVQTGARYEFESQPQVQGGSAATSFLPRLAGPQESTGYQPTTFAGALVKNQETKRQSNLQGQDIQNALTAFDTAGRQQAAGVAVAEQRAGREAVSNASAAKLTEDKRQFDALQGLPKFEYRTKYDPATGLPTGTEVFNGGQPVQQPAGGVTVEQGKAAIKAGAPKAEVNKRLVAAGLAPIP